MSLDAQQRDAAWSREFSVVVQAGAGSGKTRVVEHRVRNLVAQGIAPERIAVVTFTRAGATELQSRLADTLASRAWVGTIHSLGLRILRSAGDRRPVIPLGEQYDLAARVVAWAKKEGISLPQDDTLAEVLKRITAERYQQKQDVSPLVAMYLGLLRAGDYLDFDDLVTLPPELRYQKWRGRYDALIVDEAQDTAEAEWRLLVKCLLPATLVTIVGDPQQSIYGFRGVRTFHRSPWLAELLGQHVNHRPVLYPLQTNYRSDREIVRLSNLVSQVFSYHLPVEAASQGAGEVAWLEDVGQQWVAQDAMAQLRAGHGPAAILCRTNKEVRAHKAFYDAAQLDPPEILTMHAAKGREWPCVYVTGLTHGRFPLPFADQEEERRLLYVAVTRARHQLVLVGEGIPSSFWTVLQGEALDGPERADHDRQIAVRDQEDSRVGGRGDSPALLTFRGADAPPPGAGVRGEDDGK